jgi:hypothetical protein
MSERKMVRRSVAIAVGIICIILAVGLVGAILNLQNQVNDLTNTLNLGKSSVMVDNQIVSQSAGSYYSWHLHGIGYAGYISVDVQSSTTNDTYVRIIYSAYGRMRFSYGWINYDNQTSVGTGDTVNVPVLPYTVLEVRVGNSNLINGATEIVTITYYY